MEYYSLNEVLGLFSVFFFYYAAFIFLLRFIAFFSYGVFARFWFQCHIFFEK